MEERAPAVVAAVEEVRAAVGSAGMETVEAAVEARVRVAVVVTAVRSGAVATRARVVARAAVVGSTSQPRR